MGPAFSLAIIAFFGILMAALVYVVTDLYTTRFVALVAAVAFVTGAEIGGVGFLAVAGFFLGSTEFMYGWQLAAFLGDAAGCALLAGGLSAALAVRWFAPGP